MLDVMIENFEQRFKELDLDKTKRKKSTFHQSVCSHSWQNGFQISKTDRSSEFSGSQITLREVTGDGRRAGLNGLLEGSISHNLSRVTINKNEIHFSL